MLALASPLVQHSAEAALKEQLILNKDDHRNTQRRDTVAILVEGKPL